MTALDIRIDASFYTGNTNFEVYFSVANDVFAMQYQNIYAIPTAIGALDPTNSIFPDVQTAVDYYVSQNYPGAVVSAINSYIGTSYTLGNIIYCMNDSTAAALSRNISSFTPTLVSTGATGTQVSATQAAQIRATVSTQATATIAGSAVSTVTAKICSVNSATEANWTVVGVAETSQAYSLAVALQGVTGAKQQLVFDVPAGWYYKLVNSGSGTHSETVICGQKAIFGTPFAFTY